MGQRYWTVRCLKDYSSKSNKRNIDLLNILSEDQDWWDVAKKNKTILNKLRWATLGYHHNWDTKVRLLIFYLQFLKLTVQICRFTLKIVRMCSQKI